MMPSPQARKSARALVSWPPNLNFATLKFFLFSIKILSYFRNFMIQKDEKRESNVENPTAAFTPSFGP